MPAAIARASHVFIAGLPRTGSTLTHRILNRSPEVRLAGETHFLGARTPFGRRTGYADRFAEAGDLRTDAGLEGVVTAVYASRGKSFWSRFASTVERTEFERLLRDSDRSRRALFDAAMRAFAQGRPVAGDKTPEHIDAVPTLLSWFPEARVVHTFRDPRAIYVSLRRKERAESLSRGWTGRPTRGTPVRPVRQHQPGASLAEHGAPSSPVRGGVSRSLHAATVRGPAWPTPRQP